MEDLTLPSVGGSLNKWVHCAPILPKCQEVPHHSKKKIQKNQKNSKTGLRPTGDCWLPPCPGRPTTGHSPTSNQRSEVGWPWPTSPRPLVACLSNQRSSADCAWVPFNSLCVPIFPPASLFFPPSSPTFGHFGQLHLIGYSTCPPCLEFA
jgi:hypothetical protein